MKNPLVLKAAFLAFYMYPSLLSADYVESESI